MTSLFTATSWLTSKPSHESKMRSVVALQTVTDARPSRWLLAVVVAIGVFVSPPISPTQSTTSSTTTIIDAVSSAADAGLSLVRAALRAVEDAADDHHACDNRTHPARAVACLDGAELRVDDPHDAGGNATWRLRVVVDPNGNVINAFPS